MAPASLIQGLRSRFPAPPKVHWVVLIAAGIAAWVLISFIVPRPYRLTTQVAVELAWPVYFCLWLRKLDSNSIFVFWCGSFVLVELLYVIVSRRQNVILDGSFIATVLAWTSFALGIGTIVIVRSELLKHYNEREPYGIRLNRTMSFFFSFIYFQSQLYPIAKAKQEIRERRIAGYSVPIE